MRRAMAVLGMAAVVAAGIAGLSLPAQAAPSAAEATAVPLIEPAALKKLMAGKTAYFLIDVRTNAEFAAGHIDGAILMPLDTLPATYRRIPKGVKLVVYCRSGHRSAQAVSFLRGVGYDKAVSLNGGYLAWSGAKP